jgi:hypothetical protein
MAGQDEQLVLAAKIVDQFSPTIRDLQRSLRSLAATTSETHKAGTSQAKTHATALADLGRATREASEHFKAGLAPAMSALGVTSISAAGGIAAVVAAVKSFATSARDMSMLSTATGLSINQLRLFDKEAGRLGITAGTMRGDIAAMAETLAKAFRVPGGARSVFASQSEQFYRFIESLRGMSGDQQINAVVGQLRNIEEAARRAGKTTAEITAEKQKYLGLFSLPKELAQVPYKQLQEDLQEIWSTQSKLSADGVKGGLELQKAFDHLSDTLSDLKDDIGSDFAEPMRQATDAVRDFVKENKGELIHSLHELGAAAKEGATAIGLVGKTLGELKNSQPVDLSGLINLAHLDRTWEVFLAHWRAKWLAFKADTGFGGRAEATTAEDEYHRLRAKDFPEEAQKESERRSFSPLPFSYGTDVQLPHFSTGDIHRYLYGDGGGQPQETPGHATFWQHWFGPYSQRNTGPSQAPAEPQTPQAQPMRYVPQTDEGAPRLIKAAWSPEAAEGLRAMPASWTQTGGPSLKAGVGTGFDAERSIEGATERGSHKGVYQALWDFAHDQSPDGTGGGGAPGGVTRASYTPSGAGAGGGAGGGGGGEGAGPGGAFRPGASPMGNVPPEGGAAKPQYPTSLDQLGGGASGTPSKGDPRGMLSAVRQAAIKNGINPDLMERVARGEGLSAAYDASARRENSWGAMQLHRGGAGSVGTEFERQTGLNLSDPRNEKAEIDFAAKWIKNHGWGAWSAARSRGIVGRTGVGIDTSRWAHELTPAKPPQFTLADIHRSVEGSAASPQASVHPGADIAPGAVTAVGGAPPQAFIFHHTGGRGTIEGVQNTLRQRGLGVEYAMDRDGNIRQIGGPGSANILPGSGVGAGLNNRNIVGMEVIGKNDADINAAQVKAAQEFINKNYPNTPVYGHGEVNPGHKEATEGATIVNAIRNARALAGEPQPAASGPTKMHGQALRDHFGHRSHADLDLLGHARRAGFVGGPQQHKVTGDASLSVEINGLPTGSRTKLSANGMFRKTTLRRGPAMALARDDA